MPEDESRKYKGPRSENLFIANSELIVFKKPRRREKMAITQLRRALEKDDQVIDIRSMGLVDKKNLGVLKAELSTEF